MSPQAKVPAKIINEIIVVMHRRTVEQGLITTNNHNKTKKWYHKFINEYLTTERLFWRAIISGKIIQIVS